jgi:hypothetical protein
VIVRARTACVREDSVHHIHSSLSHFIWRFADTVVVSEEIRERIPGVVIP